MKPDARTLLGTVAALVLLAHAGHYLGTWTDDAYITFRYARNFAAGQGMTFNPGEHFEGLTNLGWALFLSLFGDTSALRVARAFGALAAVGCVGLFTRWSRHAGLSLAATTAGLGALVLAPWLPYWSVQGMETPIVALLVTLGWTRFVRERQKPGPPLAALGLGLGPWVRPDAALVPLVLGGWQALRWPWTPHARRSAAAIVASGLALVGVKLMLFGQILPNTFHVKTGGPLDRGLAYLHSLALDPSPGLSLLLGLGLLRGLVWATRRDDRAVPTLLAAFGLAAIVLQNGDFMANFRLVVPLWPALCAALALAIHDLADRTHRRAGWVALAVTVAALVPLAMTQTIDGADAPTRKRITNKTAPLLAPWMQDAWGQGLTGRMPFATAWTLAHAAPDDVVAYTDIGMMAYVSDVDVVDLLALTDPVMAGRNGESWPEQWAYLNERVTWLLVDVPDGQWPRYKQPLTDAGWTLHDGCENVWVFRNPSHPVRTVSSEERARRLERALVREPDAIGLHAALAYELNATGASDEEMLAWIDRVEALPNGEGNRHLGPLRCRLGLEEGCETLPDTCGTSQTRVDLETRGPSERWPESDHGGLAPQDPEQLPWPPLPTIEGPPPTELPEDALGPATPPDPSDVEPGEGPRHTITRPKPRAQAEACAEAVEEASSAWTALSEAWPDPEGRRVTRRAAAQMRAGPVAAGEARDAAQALAPQGDERSAELSDAAAATDRLIAACE